MFDIELETAANTAGYDGRFTTGTLTGRTVNIKAYTKRESMLDINPKCSAGLLPRFDRRPITAHVLTGDPEAPLH